MYDFAYPYDNEEELLEEYYKNGIKNVVLCYKVNKKDDLKIFERKNIIVFKKINVFKCAIVESEDINNIIKLSTDLFYSEKYYNDFVFIKTSKHLKNILNKYYYNGLLNPIGKITYKYFFKDLDYSDLNKIKRNNLSVLFSLKESIKDKMYSIIYFNKIAQKKGIDILLGSFAQKKEEVPTKIELYSLRKVFGIKYSLKYQNKIFYKQLKRTRLAKRKDYFRKGYYIVKYPYEDCSEY